MPSLNCYRVPTHIDDKRVTGFDDAVNLEASTVASHGPIERDQFRAQLYVAQNHPHDARWASFLRDGFGDNVQLGQSSSPAALLLVEVQRRGQALMFAFPFGIAGRFLLRSDAFERGYGLRAALNILYPRTAAAMDPARLKSVDSKRRSKTIIRSRSQVSESSTFETFGVNQLRDVLSKATGVPANRKKWGQRVGGGDALNVGLDVDFDSIGDLCRRIDAMHERDDYKDNFDFIDFVQPINDPTLRRQLEDAVLEQLRTEAVENLSLAPPEVIDWDRVSSFHYHFDRPQGPAGHRHPATHVDLRLGDYLNGLQAHGALDDLVLAYLRRRHICALEAGGGEVHKWNVWQCLVGELVLNGDTYILDEGDFFRISGDYIIELDRYIDGIATSAVELPPSTRSLQEPHYNKLAAASNEQFVLLDTKTVAIPGRTTPVEICDLLTSGRQLIHVKRHLGSSDLSHLFAQGHVSAELLQMNPEFRSAAHAKIKECSGGRDGFGFLDVASIVPRDFEIVYAIVEAWRGRTMAVAPRVRVAVALVLTPVAAAQLASVLSCPDSAESASG